MADFELLAPGGHQKLVDEVVDRLDLKADKTGTYSTLIAGGTTPNSVTDAMLVQTGGVLSDTKNLKDSVTVNFESWSNYTYVGKTRAVCNWPIKVAPGDVVHIAADGVKYAAYGYTTLALALQGISNFKAGDASRSGADVTVVGDAYWHTDDGEVLNECWCVAIAGNVDDSAISVSDFNGVSLLNYHLARNVDTIRKEISADRMSTVDVVMGYLIGANGTPATASNNNGGHTKRIDRGTFNSLTIIPSSTYQVAVCYYNDAGTFVKRDSWSTAPVTVNNDYSIIVDFAQRTVTDVNNDETAARANVSIIDASEIHKWHGRAAAFVGDSITYGTGTTNGNIYYQLMKYAIGFSSVYADGVGGSCYSTKSDYGTSNSPIVTRYQNIPATSDLIVIFAGTNDYGHGTPLGTIADTTDVSFYGALSVVINGILGNNPTARLVLATPLHRYGFGGFTYDTDQNAAGCTLSDYVNAIKDVARMYGIPVIDTFSASGLNPQISAVNSAFFTDGLHPKASGHARIADYMTAQLATI